LGDAVFYSAPKIDFLKLVASNRGSKSMDATSILSLLNIWLTHFMRQLISVDFRRPIFWKFVRAAHGRKPSRLSSQTRHIFHTRSLEQQGGRL